MKINLKNYILIGSAIVVIGLIITSSYLSYFNKNSGEQITRRGIFLSSCNLENYDECISRIGMKSGPLFEICWNNIKTFEEAVRNSTDCINIVSPLNPADISDRQLQEFKNYLNKEVEITGIIKSEKWGVKGENCEMVQIGCERDIEIFILENIKQISE